MESGASTPQTIDAPFVGAFYAKASEALNAHDADRFVALLSEDVVLDHSAAPATMRGRAEVRSFYADQTWTALPDFRTELVDGPFLHPDAPRASSAWRVVGTNTGPIDPPGFAPTGRRVEIHGLDVVEFRDGLACRLRVVMDMADLMRQLGLLAAPGSRAERAMVALQRLQSKLPRRR